jgi:hypothetical protein
MMTTCTAVTGCRRRSEVRKTRGGLHQHMHQVGTGPRCPMGSSNDRESLMEHLSVWVIKSWAIRSCWLGSNLMNWILAPPSSLDPRHLRHSTWRTKQSKCDILPLTQDN